MSFFGEVLYLLRFLVTIPTFEASNLTPIDLIMKIKQLKPNGDYEFTD